MIFELLLVYQGMLARQLKALITHLKMDVNFLGHDAFPVFLRKDR